MPGWMTHKLESRFLGEISTSDNADDTSVMAESEEELKSFLMKVKEERSEEHTSELQSPTHIAYAVFCLSLHGK